MEDLIIAGTGNSRYLKSISTFLTAYPTYADFAAALIAGTLPVDFNGINLAGITQAGTALNKANLLTDATAALLGLSNATPDDAFAELAERAKIETGSYTGTGTYGMNNANSITFDEVPNLVLVWTDGRVGIFAFPGYYKAPGSSISYSNVPAISVAVFAVRANWSTLTLSWYNTNDAASQLNTSGSTYRWVAFFPGVSS